MSSIPRFDAASISTRSSARPSRIATHDGQRIARIAVLEVRAVERLREDPGERRLAGAARPDEEDRVRDAVGSDGVPERLDDGCLADDLGEGLGAPAAVERLVRRGRALRRGRASRGSCSIAGVAEAVLPCTHRRPERSRAHRDERLGPGRSAAPDEVRLVLLPSGPDTVRESPLRGTRSSTSLEAAALENGDLGWEFSPAGADCRFRAPLVPRLARHAESTADRRAARRSIGLASGPRRRRGRSRRRRRRRGPERAHPKRA